MNALYTVLLCAAFVVVEALIGGTRLLFSLPAYMALAAAAILSLLDLRRPRFPPDRFCLVSSALFVAYIAIRGFTSPVAYLAWPDQFAVAASLILYLITACYLTDPRRRLWVLAVLVLLGMVSLVVSARQFTRGDNYMLFGFLRAQQYAGRGSGLYICPDHLAFFLNVVGCLSLAAAFWGRMPLWVRLLFGYGAACLFAGLVLTASRGGVLSAAVGLSVMAFLGLLRLRRTAPGRLGGTVLALVAVLALGGAGLYGVVTRHELLKYRARILVTTQDVRLKLWRAGLEQFRVSPVFGTGAATYLYYGRRLRDPSLQDDPIRTHNDYLELLGEYGVVGAAGMLLLLAAHARMGWKTYRAFTRWAVNESETGETTASTAAAWNIGAVSAAAAAAAHSVVDFNLHIPANALLTAFVFGVLANPGRAFGQDEVIPPPRGLAAYLPRLALPALGVALLLTGAPKLPGEYYCEKARVAVRDRHYLDASGFAVRGLAYEKQNPQLYFYLGEARLALAGDGPDTPLAHSFRVGADRAYREALKLAPCDVVPMLRHAQILTMFGDLSGAEAVMAQALVWDPNSAVVQTYYGFFLQRAGRTAEAKQAYARVMQLRPNQAAATGLTELSRLGLGAD